MQNVDEKDEDKQDMQQKQHFDDRLYLRRRFGMRVLFRSLVDLEIFEGQGIA